MRIEHNPDDGCDGCPLRGYTLHDLYREPEDRCTASRSEHWPFGRLIENETVMVRVMEPGASMARLVFLEERPDSAPSWCPLRAEFVEVHGVSE